MLDGAAEELQARRVELVRPVAQPLRAVEPLVEAEAQGLARDEDDVGGLVDPVDSSSAPSVVPDTSSMPVVPARASVSRMLSAPRSEAQTSPTFEPGRRPAISWTSST